MNLQIAILLCVLGACHYSSAAMLYDCTSDIPDSNIPDDELCDIFYRCVLGRVFVYNAAPGTLFDAKQKKTAASLAVANCNAHDCKKGGESKNIKTTCCNTYLKCTATDQTASWSMEKCPDSETFDEKEGVCKAGGVCKDHHKCREPQKTTEKANCTKKAVDGNPCKYMENSEEKNCAEGAAFSEEKCQCSIHNTNCTNTANPNEVTDPKCRATILMKFGLNGITSYTKKVEEGEMKKNTYTISTHGYSLRNNEAVLANTMNQSSYISMPFFHNNMLKGSFGILVEFRVVPHEKTDFVVVGNNRVRDNFCKPTLNVQASYSKNSWHFCYQFAQADENKPAAQHCRTITSQGAEVKMYRIALTYNSTTGDMGDTITDMDNDDSVYGISHLGKPKDGDFAAGNCPLYFGHNLGGVISKVEVHEACGDLSVFEEKLTCASANTATAAPPAPAGPETTKTASTASATTKAEPTAPRPVN